MVTIKEKKDVIGGKLLCRPIEVLNKTFPVEHGFHGQYKVNKLKHIIKVHNIQAWYYNYYQFYDIIKRLKIENNFKQWEKAHLYFKNYKPEILYSEGVYPFNLLGIIERSSNLKITDTFKVTKSLFEMVFFDYDKVYDRFDNMTFYEWSKKFNIHQKFFDVMYKPALSVVFNEPEKISAAEVLVFIHMYFLSDAKADNRMITKINSYDAVLKPWVEYLEKLNVKILTSHSVNILKVNEMDLSVYGSDDD